MADKETVIVSLCTFGVPCRMHGKDVTRWGNSIYNDYTEVLREKYNVLPLCGSIMGGLPTPRTECKVIETQEGLRVVGKKDPSIDYTEQYKKGAEEVCRLADIFKVTKAYLLPGCPMCGRNYGILARLLQEKGIPVCDMPYKKKKK